MPNIFAASVTEPEKLVSCAGHLQRVVGAGGDD